MTKRPGLIKGFVICATIAVGALVLGPSVAEAQSRGMMQVSANVVSTDNAFRALEAARTAVRAGVPTAAGRSINGAPTVARVAVTEERQTLVVTIDYSRN